jgi:predicted DNA-binding transcriptional regulator YafY
VRFFGRKVYGGACLVLVSLLRHGPTRARQEELKRLFGVSPRTLERWRQWWLAEFSRNRWWQSAKGFLMPPIEADLLPGGIFGRIQGGVEDRLVLTLRFLSPMTTTTASPPA